MWHDQKRDEVSDARFAEYLDDFARHRMDRRTMIRRGAMIGLSMAAIAGLQQTFEPRAGAQSKTQVRLASWAGVDEANQLAKVLEPINAAATDFQVVSEPQPADYYVKLQTVIAGGTAADLFWLSQEYVPNYADRGALLDITDQLKNDQSGLGAAKLDDYFPEALKTVQYQDKTYGLPWISAPVLMYYNPAMFQAAGVPEPDDTWNWDMLKQAAQKLTNPSAGQYGITFNDWPPIQMFIWQAGGDVISKELDSCPIDSAEAIAGAQFYGDIIYNPQYAPSQATIADQQFEAMVKAGKVAMFYGGTTDDYDYAHATDPNAAVMKAARVPQGAAGRQTLAYTASTVVNGATKNKDAAYKALVAVTEGIQHWKIVAPRQSLANAETISASVPGKAASSPVIVQAVQDMRTFNIIPDQADWDQTYFDEFKTPLYAKQATAADLAPKVKPDLEDLLP